MNKKYLLLSAFFVMLFSFGASAQHDGHDHGSHDDHDHGHGHGFHKHHAAVFLGATTNLDHNHNFFTAGLDYEYRFSQRFGAGLAGELLTNSHGKEIVFGIPLFYHTGSFKIVAGPMAAYVLAVDNGHGGTTQSALHYGARIGAGYDFHIGALSITPTVNYDYIESSALVYGLGIGMGF